MTPHQTLAIALVCLAREAIDRASNGECPAARQRLRLAMLRADRVGVTAWCADELLATMEPETEAEREELDAMGKP
jgi:hypothetical protein